MRIVAAFIVVAVLSAGLLLAGGAAAAQDNPRNSGAFCSATPTVDGSMWRMEVSEDEAAYAGPSIHDRFNHHWSAEAKKRYRWTSVAMPIDTGASTQLMAISTAIIAEGVPALKSGDIVDVAVGSQLIDYSKGRAPVIVRRVCAARDERCLDGLHKRQEGRVAGVEVGGRYSVAGNRKLSPPLGNLGCASLKSDCRGEVAAASR